MHKGRGGKYTYVAAESSLLGMGGIGDGILDRLGQSATAQTRNRRGEVEVR